MYYLIFIYVYICWYVTLLRFVNEAELFVEDTTVAPSFSLPPFSHAPAFSLTPSLSSHTPFRVGVVGVSMSRWGVRMHTHVHVDAH